MHYLLNHLRDVFVLDLELCTSVKLVIDLKLSLVERFVLLIQRPLMVCNWPWFGRTVTGQFRIGAERFALKVHSLYMYHSLPCKYPLQGKHPGSYFRGMNGECLFPIFLRASADQCTMMIQKKINYKVLPTLVQVSGGQP